MFLDIMQASDSKSKILWNFTQVSFLCRFQIFHSFATWIALGWCFAAPIAGTPYVLCSLKCFLAFQKISPLLFACRSTCGHHNERHQCSRLPWLFSFSHLQLTKYHQYPAVLAFPWSVALKVQEVFLLFLCLMLSNSVHLCVPIHLVLLLFWWFHCCFRVIDCNKRKFVSSLVLFGAFCVSRYVVCFVVVLVAHALSLNHRCLG